MHIQLLGISAQASRELDEGIINGRWCNLEAARRWLKHNHKIEKNRQHSGNG